MKLIVIVQPGFFEDEAAVTTSLFDAGLEILHLCKPDASYEDIDKLLCRLPAEYMERIVTHDHFELASERSLEDAHLSRRNPVAPTGFVGHVNRPCHLLEEVTEYKATCNYAFLSPIYSSISEERYIAAYAFGDLQEVYRAGVTDSGVMASGGVTAEHLPEINSLGSDGVGSLGDIWQRTGTDFINHLRELLRLASTF